MVDELMTIELVAIEVVVVVEVVLVLSASAPASVVVVVVTVVEVVSVVESVDWAPSTTRTASMERDSKAAGSRSTTVVDDAG